jgi:hypothetical protein
MRRFVTGLVFTQLTIMATAADARWIDAKTGKPVADRPVITDPTTGKTYYIQAEIGNPNRAFDPNTGRNFARDECGNWIDAKTGKSVASRPVITDPATGKTYYIQAEIGDPNRAFDPNTGRNFVREPCPPAKPASTTPPRPPLKLDKTSSRILDIHNVERFAVGAPPLRWDPALAAAASAYAAEMARTGQMVHAPREGRGITRENLSEAAHGSSPDQLMRNWLAERRNFVPGTYPNVSRTGNWLDVSHYSQIIWPTTLYVGCATARGAQWDFFVCRYSPGGNKDGKSVGVPTAMIERG